MLFLFLFVPNTTMYHHMSLLLLDLSRLEMGKVTLRVQRGDVMAFLRRTVLAFESWAERKQIDLGFEADPESAEGFFDRDKLEKIITNLVSNALKFTDEGGAVGVHASLQESTLRITVEDTGCGISADQLPHVFDRFYRADETHRTEGTGIGLALTKELVELHRGRITVESTPNRGSLFTLVLRVDQSSYRKDEIVESPPPELETAKTTAAEAVAEEGWQAPAHAPVEESPTVLLVEDNADLRAYLRESLEGEYAIREAGDGRKGVEIALECIPDIVVSDVMMPGLDGYELTRALREDVRTSHLPIILLTARVGIESKIEGLERGADDYVTKPFDSRELVVRIRNLIEQRKRLRQKFAAGIELKPGEVAVTTLDDALLRKVMAIVERNMGEEKFSIEDLAREACLSRAHLNRKLRALTDHSTADFIRLMRLQRARELLQKRAGTVSEIAYQVGFGSPSHFSATFRQRFGIPPSEILQGNT